MCVVSQTLSFQLFAERGVLSVFDGMATQLEREKPPALAPEQSIRAAHGTPPVVGPLRAATQAPRRQPKIRQHLQAAAIRLFRWKRNRRRTNTVLRHPSGERHTSGRFESLVRFAPRRFQ